MSKKEIAIFWFRRDLRLHDNCALFHALKSGYPVIPIFIFDKDILNELPKNDARVSFIYETLNALNNQLIKIGSAVKIEFGSVEQVWEKLLKNFNIKEVYSNKDYEPYAIKRDLKIEQLCSEKDIAFKSFKDQVIFEEAEIVKDDGLPYTVYTPYKNKWLKKYSENTIKIFPSEQFLENLHKEIYIFPSLSAIGFQLSEIKVLPYNNKCISSYNKTRDLPFVETSNLSVHLRFGTVSIRKLADFAIKTNATFASELIWREFFMQILYHFPKVVHQNFREKYNYIPWRNNEVEFKLWCEGKTGYPIVDAGMRQLNQTGYMHNRVRMITASFLCKHLLIDWRWGEAYFAKKLLDYDLSANNGNWQWVAGTGCDAAPYYRVFNPLTQQQKFDSDLKYTKKWNSNFKNAPEIVEHKFARERYLSVLKKD
ncbi:cryptochrome/photolyase family protein [Lutibacter maritimus]|uniref:Deoxyribodipyrimidine photo-lyase n=1 Tax=Lutibacter maritimus TaxID=593133 RepID=A0A1I6NPF1_9FLAO|nr:deoxyribodipyrimidine photo-lyase [Lutibacter maritimus]SFS29741.1 deoxyribodipyrimidine photo-lyase [Lutibacter maritimus]